MYKGNFEDGKIHGKGVLVNLNGVEKECEWENNKLIKR